MPVSVGWWKENRHSGLDEEALNSSKVHLEGLHGRYGKSLGNLTSVPVFGVPPTIYVGLYSASEWGFADKTFHLVGIDGLTSRSGSCWLMSLGGQ